METSEFHILKEWSGKTLQEVLSIALSISKGEAKKLLDRKCVFVNNRRTWMAKHEVRPGDLIAVAGDDRGRSRGSEPKKLLIYKDEQFLIFNKPAGLTSNGAGSFETEVQKGFASNALRAAHRLDRDTSGCLIFSRSQEAWDALYELFKEKNIRKTYHVLCVGSFAMKEKKITAPIDGKEACSTVRPLQALGELTLLEVEIETGRTHQIRKHLLSIGLPVLGDKEYTSRRSESGQFRNVRRQMLHAVRIDFINPFSGKKIAARAAYPDDFAAIVKRGG